MASIGHVAVGLAAARAHSGRAVSWRTLSIFGALALLPDLDAIAFHFRIPYGAEWGHRGAAHSLAIALSIGVLGAWLTKSLRSGAFVALVVASHGLLDSLTDGGLGVALLWPFSEHRYFAPWRPIPVAPIGIGMLSDRGSKVIIVEALMFWPFALYALWGRRQSPATDHPAPK